MKSRLSQNEKYIVQARIHNGDDIKTISKSIGRQSKTVQLYINELDKIHETITNIQIEQAKQPSKNKHVEEQQNKLGSNEKVGKGQFVNKTAGNRDGVAIMTQAASELGDHHTEIVTADQQYIIDGMLEENFSVSQIANKIGKGERAIRAYIDNKNKQPISRTARGNLYDITNEKVRT